MALSVKMKEFKVFIDQKALIHNYNYLKKIRNKKIIAVVKANAYGHGIENIVEILRKEGCEYFAVSREKEVERILKLNLKDIKILLLQSIENISILKKNKNVEMIVNSYEILEKLIEKEVCTEQLHIKIDFGFGRNGISENNLEKIKKIIKEKKIKFKGISTHLFAAEYDDMLEIERRFNIIIEKLGKENFEVIHMQNSAGVTSVKGNMCTHIRCGTTLYGFQDSGYYIGEIQKVFKLRGKISEIKEIETLKYIGYELKEDLHLRAKKVALIKIGYGDGFSKRSEKIMSIINNKKFEILSVNMDCTYVSIDNSVKNEDEIEIFYDVEETKEHYKTYNCEFLIGLNENIEREILDMEL